MPRIPLSWLAESVDLVDPDPHAVAQALVQVGLEEEGIHEGPIAGPLVLGKVLSVSPETASNGKTVNYCRVDVGAHNDPAGPGKGPDADASFPASRGIVCGAHNFGVGDLVVVALPGAELPGPFAISARKTYGYISDGMICSVAELGLGDDHTGILVLPAAEVLAAELIPGDDLKDFLGLAEVAVEVNVTPDRGYCFAIRGVAREYSLATGSVFTDPAPNTDTVPTGTGFRIELQDEAPIRGEAGCRYFTAWEITGFDPQAPSPWWMRGRLVAAGMRPISLAVDVTNYVMLELGQPLHAYDLDLLAAPIVVRRAAPGESCTTLDGAVRELHPEDLVISDSAAGIGSRVIGLAGVMGGANTEVSSKTSRILLEAAHFDPISVARTARRHKIFSEAARRFERGVDPHMALAALLRARDLLLQYGGGEAAPIASVVGEIPNPTPISMPVSYPSQIAGVEYAPETVTEILGRIGAEVQVSNSGLQLLSVTPPSWRPDLSGAIDLVEEVCRIDGYGNIPSRLPKAPAGRGLTQEQRSRRKVARTLVAAGLTEVLTYPFVSRQRLTDLAIPETDPRWNLVQLANPIQADVTYLRTSVLATILDAAHTNLSRGAADFAIFEIGRTFFAVGDGSAPRLPVDGSVTAADLAQLDAQLPHQPRMVAGLLAGYLQLPSWDGSGRKASWSDAIAAAAAVVEAFGVALSVRAAAFAPWHPTRCAAFYVGDTLLGHAGEIHPRVCEQFKLPARTSAFEINLSAVQQLAEGEMLSAHAIGAYPYVKEDLAFVVDQHLPAAELLAVVKQAGGPLLSDIRVFDVFMGEQIGPDKKSIALALRFRAPDRTLDSAEVNSLREQIIASVAAELSGSLRA